MPGKIHDATVHIAARRQQANLLVDYHKKCRHLSLNSVNPRNLQSILEFLRYQKGDSELLQDMKALVVRRLACEAFSQSRFDVHQGFEKLLDLFPRPPFMRDFMIPRKHELGEPQEVIDTCRPAANDTNMVLRGKREGLLFNLTRLIQDSYAVIGNKAVAKFKRGEFIECFSWTWEMLRDFYPSMRKELTEQVQAHVFAPPLPFDIELPW